jgi:dihydrolipoamide dehydrogenase
MPKKGGKREEFDYDVIVIGAGSAGFTAAETARSEGASVCIIEGGSWGGECPNFACVPTKALLKSARVYYEAKYHMREYGVYATGVTFNFANIMKRKRAVVSAITGDGKRMKQVAKRLGITAIDGKAKFIDSHAIEVNGKNLSARSFVLATGAVDFIPPVDGLESSGFINYEGAVSLKSCPKSIAIIGGGPVGCEFATFFAMLGVKVTILQLAPTVLHREDQEIAIIAQKQLVDLGVQVMTETKTLSVEKYRLKRRVWFQKGKSKRQSVVVDKILIAAGKRANVEDLNLEVANVKLDEKGRLIVKETLQTTARHIFAAGDVSGGMMFTHTAHEEGSIVGHNIVQGSARTMRRRSERVVPRATFVSPEVASVGVTPAQAKDSKALVFIAKFSIGALGRAVTDGKRVGLLKIVIDKKSRRILGGHMIGERSGEVIHEIALAMHANLKIDDVAKMIHAFPTYSEAVAAAASQV